jgi:hypothetical protein
MTHRKGEITRGDLKPKWRHHVAPVAGCPTRGSSVTFVTTEPEIDHQRFGAAAALSAAPS